ncbi:hypothetical protein DVA86_26575 [Streptomyces armeniacus]|uniref:CBM6 domain-containing protein n=1 Tax=Streptomyces armeniacus TaxID=83291 RepID=A0A345XVK5_9ACTN|nr:hypothetical protein [Streptomyces armeniacus]AXK35671.1 hypothetical protein DVA86_26575 [Streptomyces armeniacus]
MTAENNGTGAPQDDDPFAYLYRPEGGGADGGAAPAQQQPGVPRRSYNQVRAVGERQYGAQQGQHYGQTVAQPGAFPQQQGGPGPGVHGQPQGHPNAHYAAPETMPGGRAALRRQGGPGGPQGGRGGNRNGLLIGAVAVVAAVVLGIGAAMLFNNGGNAQAGGADESPSAGQDTGKPTEPDGEKSEKPDPKLPPKEDAATLRLEGGAHVEKAVPGAKGKDGTYVGGMNTPGATAKWTTKVPESGTYKLYVGYGVPGEDMHLSLGVNGKPHATGLKMKNYAKAKKGDWEKGWTYTWSTVQVDKGENTFVINCAEGDKCAVNLDQVWLKPGG